MFTLIMTVVFSVIAFAITLHFHKKHDGSAFGLKLFVCFIVCLLFCMIISITKHAVKDSKGGDTMVLNGFVTKKQKDHVSCSHSYSCNCRMVQSGKTTTTKCDTCYEHSYDVDWVVRSTVGGVVIDRVDRQGLTEPKRYRDAYIGEPFSVEKSYFNYIKASPLTVFSDFNLYKDVSIPSHPKVYDYYRVKHVVDWNSRYKSGIDNINDMLTEKLKRSSDKAKANVLVVFHNSGTKFNEAMKTKNYGGRINDLTILINAEADGKIQDVFVYSWSKSDMVNVKTRDEILDLVQLNDENNEKLVDIIDTILVKYYSHRSIEEFKYLEDNIQYPTWYYVLSSILFLGLLFGWFVLNKNEVFE